MYLRHLIKLTLRMPVPRGLRGDLGQYGLLFHRIFSLQDILLFFVKALIGPRKPLYKRNASGHNCPVTVLGPEYSVWCWRGVSCPTNYLPLSIPSRTFRALMTFRVRKLQVPEFAHSRLRVLAE